MITYRSSHIPMETTKEMPKRKGTLVRRFLTQSRFGATTLHRMRSQ